MARQIKGMRAFRPKQRQRMREILIAKYGEICQICIEANKPQHLAKIDMSTEREDRSFSIDHIVALADGGTNTIDNMWPTHIVCNERKGSVTGGSRVRTNRKPRSVSQVTGSRLAYTSSSY